MDGNKRNLPPWCKEAKKALIDRDMSVKDLATAIGYTREHVSSVINGRLISGETQERICDYLAIRAS